MTQYLFLQIFSNWEQRQSYTNNDWHELHKQWLHNCYKVYEANIKFDIEQAENAESSEKQKTSFPKR